MLNKKGAFTLAEILVALTIIGVVAAVTVPMLMSNTNARTNRLKVQKAYATLSNAFRIGQTKLDFDTSDITSLTGTGDDALTIERLLTKTMDVVKNSATSYPFAGKVLTNGGTTSLTEAASYTTTGITSDAAVFKGADGVYYIFPKLVKDISNKVIACEKDKLCVGYIDINGPKGPNELITCTSGTAQIINYSSSEVVRPAECTVDDNAVTDIYPFAFYKATVRPATSAFETVLNGEADD